MNSGIFFRAWGITIALGLFAIEARADDPLLCLVHEDLSTKDMIVIPEIEVVEFLRKKGVWDYVDGSYLTFYGPWLSKEAKEKKIIAELGFTGKEAKMAAEEGLDWGNNIFVVKNDLQDYLIEICNNYVEAAHPEETLLEVRARFTRFLPAGHPVVSIKDCEGEDKCTIGRVLRKYNSRGNYRLVRKDIIKYAAFADMAYKLESEPERDFHRDTKAISPSLEIVHTTTSYHQSAKSQYKSGIVAVSFIDMDEKAVYVSYKGTSTLRDLRADAQLMLAMFFAGSVFMAYINDAKRFFAESLRHAEEMPAVKLHYSKEEFYNVFKIIVTGHSLGAFLAAVVATKISRSGDISIRPLGRVFSAPSPHLSKYEGLMQRLFDPPEHLGNVVNFARDSDPVVRGSGRHPENMVIFGAGENPLALDSHYLKYFTAAIHEGMEPQAIFFQCEDDDGHGIERTAQGKEKCKELR